jgi:hypothetical protein
MESKYYKIMKNVSFLSILCFLSFVFSIGSASIRDSRLGDQAICTPNSYHKYPFIPLMTSSNAQEIESELYMFIEQYVHDVYNETIVDYQKPSKFQRRNYTYLKAPLQRAISHSKGEALAQNMKLYKDSFDRYRILKDKNVGWLFNIQAIESIRPINNMIRVTVLGEFQKTVDKMYSEMDHEFWGYKRIYLTITREYLEPHKNESLRNKSGYYVVFQDIETLSETTKDKLLNSSWENVNHIQ